VFCWNGPAVEKNARALPRAWLASDALALGEDETLGVIRTGRLPDGSRWEPQRTALVETAQPASPHAGGGNVEITSYEANLIELKCSAAAPSILVLAENHYPGWVADVDGRPAEVLRVNYGLRGVFLPAGEHRVEFIYRPKSVLVGIAVSLLTAAALAFATFVPTRSRGVEL
jgi:hypothetical protein